MVHAFLLLHELLRAGNPEGFLPVFLRTVLFSEVHVAGNIAGEQDVLLRNIPDQVPQLFLFVFFHIDTVNQYFSERHIIEPGDQLHDAGLAAAGPADDRRGLTGL